MNALVRRAFVLAAVMAGASTMASGCSREPATELVAGFTTQLQVPKELQTIRIDLKAKGIPIFCNYYRVYDGKVRLPRTLGINKPPEGENVPVTVTVTGYTEPYVSGEAPFTDCERPPDDRVLRRSTQPYRPNHILYLPMPLHYSCFDLPKEKVSKLHTDETTTCKGGLVVDSSVDVNALPEYDDSLVYGSAPASCFSPLLCASGMALATLEDKAQCLYEIAPGEGAGMNVRVIYEGFVSEILDEDPDEGFTRVDPTHIKLAPGLCAGDASKKILSVGVSRQCAPKTLAQPLCNDAFQVLIPSPNALDIVMDRRQPSMDKVYAQTVIDGIRTALQDPAFSTTDLATRFAPAESGDHCATDNYDTQNLDIPFKPAIAASEILHSILPPSRMDDGSNLWPTSAIVKGSISALGKYTPPAGFIGFNTRALMLLTARDPLEGGCGTDTDVVPAVDAAFKSANAIKTFVFMAPQPPPTEADPTPFDQTAVDHANQIAFAGGTDHALGFTEPDKDPLGATAEAMSEIVATLSSCAYEKPGVVTDQSAVITINGEPVPYDASCSATSTGGNGWAFTGTQIRICGAPCTKIKDLQKALNFFRGRPEELPPLLITATQALDTQSDAPPPVP